MQPSFNQFLVSVNGKPEILTPATSIVVKQGKKQFYAYIGHKAVLCQQDTIGYVAIPEKSKQHYSRK